MLNPKQENIIIKSFDIEDEDKIPTELLNAEKVQVLSAIGWIDLDEPEFRCGLKYRACNGDT